MDIQNIEIYTKSIQKLNELGCFKNLPDFNMNDVHINSFGYRCLQHITVYKESNDLDNIDKEVLQNIFILISMNMDEDNINSNIYPENIISNLSSTFLEALYNNLENDIFDNLIILSRLYDVIWIRKEINSKKYSNAGKKAFLYYTKLFDEALKQNNYFLSSVIFPRIFILMHQFDQKNILNKINTFLTIQLNEENLFFIYKMYSLIIDKTRLEKSERISTYTKIASQVQNYIKNNELSLNWFKKYANILIKIYDILKDYNEQQKILEQLAEKNIEEANKYPYLFQKEKFLSNAIESYKRINGNPHQDKIEKLYKEIQILQQKDDGFSQEHVGKFDISQSVNNIIKDFEDLDFIDFFCRLWSVNALYLPSIQSIKDSRASTQKNFLSDLLFSTSYYNHFNQTILCNVNDRHEYQYIRSFREWFFSIYLKTPLTLFRKKFFFTETDFIEIFQFHFLVPKNYEILFTKGLYYFLKGMYIESATILIPLFEHSMRHILSIKKPTIYKKDSEDVFMNHIDIEKLINDVMEEKLLNNVLLEHIKDLITDKRYNIRNYIAHGLYPQEMFYSDDVILLLYLILELYIDPFISFSQACYLASHDTSNTSSTE